MISKYIMKQYNCTLYDLQTIEESNYTSLTLTQYNENMYSVYVKETTTPPRWKCIYAFKIPNSMLYKEINYMIEYLIGDRINNSIQIFFSNYEKK